MTKIEEQQKITQKDRDVECCHWGGDEMKNGVYGVLYL